MDLISIKNKIADVEIAIRMFVSALKECIRDYKTASKIGVNYPVFIKYENKRAHIIENKYKSFLITLDDSGYNDMIRIQLCRKEGKIVNGVMMPEPIEESYIEVDARKIYSFIDVFRKVAMSIK